MKRLFFALILVLVMSACGAGASDEVVRIPTRNSPEGVQTAIVLTENAPPPGFETVAFNPIDFHLDALPGSRFEITVSFEGQYTQTGEDATSSLIVNGWENNLQRTRRVTMAFIGNALSGGLGQVEAVRFENIFYLKDQNGVCTQNSDAARELATLSAGRIVGGFTLGLPTGRKDDVNDYTGYQYGFSEADMNVVIFNNTPSTIDVQGGEAWVIPEFNVVGRYGGAFFVHNAQILFGNQPVTGTLRYEYNLFDIGEQPNIAIPNGC